MSGKSISVMHLYEIWLLNNRTVYEASVYTSCHWTYSPVSFQTTLCYADVVSNNYSVSTFNFQQSESWEIFFFFFAVCLSYIEPFVVSGYFHTLPDAVSPSKALEGSMTSQSWKVAEPIGATAFCYNMKDLDIQYPGGRLRT